MGCVWTALKLQTVASVHRGAALPAARFIVIAVPVTVAFLYWFLIGRHPKGRR